MYIFAQCYCIDAISVCTAGFFPLFFLLWFMCIQSSLLSRCERSERGHTPCVFSHAHTQTALSHLQRNAHDQQTIKCVGNVPCEKQPVRVSATFTNTWHIYPKVTGPASVQLAQTPHYLMLCFSAK